MLRSSDEEEGFETEDVKVTISAIKPDEFVKRNFIGYRKVQESESEQESEQEASDAEIKDVPGMETGKKSKAKPITDKAFEKLTEKLKSEKDVKKLVSSTLASTSTTAALKFQNNSISDQTTSKDGNEAKQNHQNEERKEPQEECETVAAQKVPEGEEIAQAQENSKAQKQVNC